MLFRSKLLKFKSLIDTITIATANYGSTPYLLIFHFFRTMSLQAIGSSIVRTRRGLLAFVWSLVTLAVLLSFVSAIIFAITTNNGDSYSDDTNNALVADVAVTSRAMVFAALWTVVLAILMSVFGMIILGFQAPTGQYYTC